MVACPCTSASWLNISPIFIARNIGFAVKQFLYMLSGVHGDHLLPKVIVTVVEMYHDLTWSMPILLFHAWISLPAS